MPPGVTPLKRPVIKLFAEKAPYLQPLPRHPYDTARVAYPLCSIDDFVAWDGNRYAVPYEAIYDVLPVRVTELPVRVTEPELFVYAPDLTLLAHHELAPRGPRCRATVGASHEHPLRHGPRPPTRDLRGPRRGGARFLRGPHEAGHAAVQLPGAAGAAPARVLYERRPRARARPRQDLRRLRAPHRRPHPGGPRHAELLPEVPERTLVLLYFTGETSAFAEHEGLRPETVRKRRQRIIEGLRPKGLQLAS